MGRIGVFLLVAYVAVCFGLIARKHGKNPWLYGLLSIISPLNLIFLGWLAFSRCSGNGRSSYIPPRG